MKSNKRASLRPTGFTLIELMVAVAIISILAMIAIPNYASYIQRSRIVDATSRLSDYRVRMEQYFLDNRKYANGGSCGVQIAAVNSSDAFALDCQLVGTGYLATATGLAPKGMQSFAYTIDQNGTKKTTALPSNWNIADNGDKCWITRKDGSCG